MTNLSLTHLQEKISNKEISIIEVVQSYLSSITSQNTSLNAFLTVTSDQALATAKKYDQALADDPSLLATQPLFGIPVAHKDIFMTEGVVTTASSKVLENYTAHYSSTVVTKLNQAGSILVGKLNCDAWAHGSSGENSDYGSTKNPHNLDYVPGGSSSGSAAAVAANMVPFSTGTDTGGSIRLPANFCGVVGFKPTYGRVSRYGVIAMASSLDSIGHFTHSVEDAAKILEITSGPDVNDATTSDSKPFTWTPPRDLNLTGVKLGVPKQYLSPIKNAEVKNNFDQVLKNLTDQGVEIIEIDLPHTDYATAVYYIIQPSEVSSNLARYTGVRYGAPRDAFGDEAKRRIIIGTFTLSAGYYDAYYKKALQVRTLIKQDFDQAFPHVDAIIAPVSPTPPFKLGEKVNDPLEMYLSDILTIPVNLAGLPAVALPTGFTSNKLPLGIQLISARYSEEKLLPLSYQIEHLLKP